MRVLIVVDKSGKIVATAQRSYDSQTPTIAVAPHPDYDAHVVDLPVELEGKSLIEFHHSWALRRVGEKMVLHKYTS